MAAVLDIAVGVVNRDVDDVQILGIVDGETLDRGVLDVQALDGRAVELMGVEEFRLVLAAVGALAVPPFGSVAIDKMTARTLDGDVGTGEADQGTLPLLVVEGSSTLESDGSAVLEVGQIKSLASRDGNVLEHDVAAALLAIFGVRGGREGAGVTSGGERVDNGGSAQ